MTSAQLFIGDHPPPPPPPPLVVDGLSHRRTARDPDVVARVVEFVV